MDSVWDAETQPTEDVEASLVVVLHAPPCEARSTVASVQYGEEYAKVIEPPTAIPHRPKKRALNELKKGKQRVLVEWPPLGSLNPRKSFAAGIRDGFAKLPSPVCDGSVTLKFHGIHLAGGLDQFYWEWVAQQAELFTSGQRTAGQNLEELEAAKVWLESSALDARVNSGHAFDGYDHVQIDEPTIALVETIPVLLVEWRSIVQYANSDAPPTLRPEIVEVARRWLEGHPLGQLLVLGDPTGQWRGSFGGKCDETWAEHFTLAVKAVTDLAAELSRPTYYHFLMPAVQGCHSLPIHVAAWLQKVHSMSFAQSILVHSGELIPFHRELCELTGILPREVEDVTADINGINAVRIAKPQARAPYLATVPPPSTLEADESNPLPLIELDSQTMVTDGRVHGLVSPAKMQSEIAAASVTSADELAELAAEGGPSFSLELSDSSEAYVGVEWRCEICVMNVYEESCPFCDNTRQASVAAAAATAAATLSENLLVSSENTGMASSMASSHGNTPVQAGPPLTVVPMLTIEDVEHYTRTRNAGRVPADTLLERGKALTIKGDIPDLKVKSPTDRTVAVLVYPKDPDRRYNIEITFGSDRLPIANSCSCPMGQQTTLCKHVVGALYRLAGIVAEDSCGSQSGNTTKEEAGGGVASGQSLPQDPPSKDGKRSLNFLVRPQKEKQKRGGKHITPAEVRTWAEAYIADHESKQVSDSRRKRDATSCAATEPEVRSKKRRVDSNSAVPESQTTSHGDAGSVSAPPPDRSGSRSLTKPDDTATSAIRSNDEHTEKKTISSTDARTTAPPDTVPPVPAAAAAATPPKPKAEARTMLDSLLDDFL